MVSIRKGSSLVHGHFMISQLIALIAWGAALFASAKEADDMTSWVISERGVGVVKLWRGIPAKLRGKGLQERYFARYIADFQPEEGFRFEHPPIEVILATGPFSRRAAKDLAPIDDISYKRAAVRAASKTKVKLIRVIGEGPRTDKGLGVGSTLDEIMNALPDARLLATPPTFGHDECVCLSNSIKKVVFVFASCESARAGSRVIRIDVGQD